MQDNAIQRRVLRRTAVFTGILILCLGGGSAWRLQVRAEQASKLDNDVAAAQRQYVETGRASNGTPQNRLELPATLQGAMETPIFARASGYLLKRNADIGSLVKKGEVLAVIDTPELQHQLDQSRAGLDESRANLDLARLSLQRTEKLFKQGVVSQQELDTRQATYAQLQSAAAASEAEQKRLQQLVAFKNIVAPFSGVVTTRDADVGDLITAGGSASKPLFTLAKTDALKVAVNVPQTYASAVKVGQTVNIVQNEQPGKVTTGKVERISGAIDATTRTLPIEISLSNADRQWLAGAFVRVILPIVANAPLTVPGNTLLFRAAGPQVAIIGDEGKVHLASVKLGRDLGPTIEILEGIQATDQLVLNPSDSLTEGDIVIAKPGK